MFTFKALTHFHVLWGVAGREYEETIQPAEVKPWDLPQWLTGKEGLVPKAGFCESVG